MTDASQGDGYLTGQLLVAMPQMLDERFAKTVIYMCAHTEDGAMGLVVNKILENIDFPDLLEQLDLSPTGGGQATKELNKVSAQHDVEAVTAPDHCPYFTDGRINKASRSCGTLSATTPASAAAPPRGCWGRTLARPPAAST